MQRTEDTISSVGQIPIDAYYFCRLNAHCKNAAPTVVILTRDMEEIGTFRTADPDILASLREVVRDRDIDRRAKQDAVRFMPLKNGYSRVISPHYSPHL